MSNGRPLNRSVDRSKQPYGYFAAACHSTTPSTRLLMGVVFFACLSGRLSDHLVVGIIGIIGIIGIRR